MTSSPVEQAVDATFREEWGRVVAALIGRTGDWDLAEECAQEAFAEALGSWQVDGVPQRDTDEALAIIEELHDEGGLEHHYLLEATQADLLRRRGDPVAAAAAYERALPLAPSEVERRYLAGRLNEVLTANSPHEVAR
jgi:predicted RNA polymerase sigma factor